MTRQCSKCKTNYGEDGFYARRESWCKRCKIAYVKSFQKVHSETTKKNKDRYVALNKDKVKETKAKYREKNRVLLRKKSSEYQKENKKAVLARCRIYQLAKLHASPKWTTKIEKELIKHFYLNCPEGYHVDHVVPIRGKNISGLHVLSNLQYLKAEENQKKSNKY